MASVQKVLIIGGGIGGLVAAVALRQNDPALDVEIIEVNPKWDVYGVGIITLANSLRALASVGLADKVLAAGYGMDKLDLYDSEGAFLHAVPQPRLAGPQYPSANALTRPHLHAILQDAVREAGVNVRLGLTISELGHVVAVAQAIERDVLGFRIMAFIPFEPDPSKAVFSVTTTNETSHDFGIAGDFSGLPGRVHHLAFWMEESEDLLRAADLLVESGAGVEFGPGRHGIGEQMYLYFREPGGLRIELNSLGYRNYVPDWEPQDWQGHQGPNSMYRNVEMPHSMFEAFPPAAGPVVGEPELAMASSIMGDEH